MPRRDEDEPRGPSGGVVALMLIGGLIAVLAVGGLLTAVVLWVVIPAPPTPRPVRVAAPEPVPVIVPFDNPPATAVAEPRPDVIPDEPPPPAADKPVVLRNVRRTAANDLVVDYEYVSGEIDPERDVLIVKGPRQRQVVTVPPSENRRTGTITLTPFVPATDAPGTVQVFFERKPTAGVYIGGAVISNVVTVN